MRNVVIVVIRKAPSSFWIARIRSPFVINWRAYELERTSRMIEIRRSTLAFVMLIRSLIQFFLCSTHSGVNRSFHVYVLMKPPFSFHDIDFNDARNVRRKQSLLMSLRVILWKWIYQFLFHILLNCIKCSISDLELSQNLQKIEGVCSS